MIKKDAVMYAIMAVFALAFAAVSVADVPPPPVNQILGIPDSVFNNLDEAGCRFCHDNPNIVPPPPGAPDPNKVNVNRHHLRYGLPLEEGFCSVNTDATCQGDGDCPNAGPAQLICSGIGTPCQTDGDCPAGQQCGEICVGDSVAPLPPAADGTYQCTTCHPILSNGQFDIIVVRDCLFCHEQVAGEASVHHLSADAQSANCKRCHGDLVNNIGDGHYIPTYSPSLVTPSPSGGDGEPRNVENNGAGACNYCHSTGTGQPGSVAPGIVDDPMFIGIFGPVEVYRNSETHHSTGLGRFDNAQCLWCHNIDNPGEAPIRRCEGCHGPESLHNIALDSDDPGSDFTPAMENPGWSHIGNNDDCWGCHGFATAAAESAPFSGPTVPFIESSDVESAIAGTSTQVTLSGLNFKNTMDGTAYRSDVVLTAADGSYTEVAADSVSESSLTFTIASTVAPGNYEVRAVKAGKASNQVNISVIPAALITYMKCSTKSRMLTINGVNFMEQFTGAEDYINVKINGAVAPAVAWTDTQIVVPVPDCRLQPDAEVSGLYNKIGKKCSKGCVEKKRRRRR